ncbi:MAG: TetR/AcrR family transcriptional regulator [Actinobacteria bacterium]|nr:MAG: TetR/AcrR family transcriptional regulator [Actinomycetota bacterium]
MARDPDTKEPAWRQRAVSRSLTAARTRAEERVQRFLDAAFSLIDEKGSTDFTIQEIIDRSGQSLRGFYQHFEGKDDLLLALFDETIQEAAEDLRRVVDSASKPIERLRAFTVRLYEWCDPEEKPRRRGSHNRLPIMHFMLQLAPSHPDRVKAAMVPISSMLLELLDESRAGWATASCTTPGPGRTPRRPGPSASTASAAETGQTRSRSSMRMALPRSTL